MDIVGGILNKSLIKPEAQAIEEVNAQISDDDPSSLLAAIHNEHAELQNVDDHNQLHYLRLLKAAQQAKIQVSSLFVPRLTLLCLKL